MNSQETLGNGVLVKVSGELSNNGEPMRKFVQTFALARHSPKKYYVHIDIFHYQNEVWNKRKHRNEMDKWSKTISCQVFDKTADSNVSHVSGSSEMDNKLATGQAKEPAPSQQPPPHTNRGNDIHEVGGGDGGSQPQVTIAPHS